MHTGRMSRMRTSCASLLWARPAMRRACSSGVRAGSGPFFAASLAAVDPELGDLLGHRGARKSEPRPGVELHPLVAGLRGDEHDELLQPKVAYGGVREREVPVVRRVERTAEQARGHANSTISSPRSTSSPALAPAAFNAS